MGKALSEIGFKGGWRYAIGQIRLSVIKSQLVPPQFRAALLRLWRAKIGKNTIIHPVTFSNLYRTGFKGFKCGRDCFIGEECFLDMADSVSMGDQVTLAERVMIMTHLNVGFRDHPLQDRFPSSSDPVEIDSGVFIGAGAIILPGVKIGKEAFVAAGALVNRNVEPHSVVAGVPARIISSIEGERRK